MKKNNYIFALCIAAWIGICGAEGKPAAAACPPAIGNAFNDLRAGKRLTIREIYQSEKEWDAYFEEFNDRSTSTRDTRSLRERQADCYTVMVKMALINFVKHGGWPFRAPFLEQAAEELKQRAATTDDPVDHFYSIIPSLIAGDPDHAVRSFKSIKNRDPFLSDVAAEWVLARVPESAHKVKFTEATE